MDFTLPMTLRYLRLCRNRSSDNRFRKCVTWSCPTPHAASASMPRALFCYALRLPTRPAPKQRQACSALKAAIILVARFNHIDGGSLSPTVNQLSCFEATRPRHAKSAMAYFSVTRNVVLRCFSFRGSSHVPRSILYDARCRADGLRAACSVSQAILDVRLRTTPSSERQPAKFPFLRADHHHPFPR